MTPQLQRWLEHGLSEHQQYGLRRATQTRLFDGWLCALSLRGEPVGVGVGTTTDDAEIAALEEYAKRIFVPGALAYGRKTLGLRQRRGTR